MCRQITKFLLIKASVASLIHSAHSPWALWRPRFCTRHRDHEHQDNFLKWLQPADDTGVECAI